MLKYDWIRLPLSDVHSLVTKKSKTITYIHITPLADDKYIKSALNKLPLLLESLGNVILLIKSSRVQGYSLYDLSGEPIFSNKITDLCISGMCAGRVSKV